MSVVSHFKSILAEANTDKEDIQVLAEDYLYCLKYFYKEAVPPLIRGFVNGNSLLLDTDIGKLDFEEIPEDEITYSIYRAEIKVLFDEVSYSEEEILKYTNDYINQKWK